MASTMGGECGGGQSGPFSATELVNALAQAVIVTDPQGRIRLWNAAAEELYGWAAEEVLGRPIVEITPTAQSTEDAARIFAQLAAGECWEGDFEVRRRDGRRFLARVVDTPIIDHKGELVGIVGISEDITERRAVEERLRESQGRLRLALTAGRLGMWEWDRAASVFRLDADLQKLFGVDDDQVKAGEAFLHQVHPGDRETVAAVIQRTIDAGGDFHLEHRILRPDGTERWVEAHGQAIRDWGGRVDAMVGVAQDITERRATQQERDRLLNAEHAARKLAEHAADQVRRLHAVGVDLADALKQADVAERVTRHAVEALGASGGSVALLTAKGDLEVIAAHGYREELLEPFRRFPLDAPLPLAETARTGRPVQCSSAAELRDRYPHLAEHVGERPWAAATQPLVAEGRTLGALALSFDRERRLTLEESAFLAALAQQCAQALERARLHERTLSTAERLRRLYEAESAARAAEEALRRRFEFLAEAAESLAASLDLGDVVRRFTDLAVPRLAESCAVELLLPDGRHTTVAAVGERQGRSRVTLPLIVHGHPLGNVHFGVAEGRELGRDDRLLAEELVRRAAVAIENARLHADLAETEQSLRFQTTLLESQSEAGIDGVIVVSPQGRILWSNHRFVELWGFPTDVLETGSDEVALEYAKDHLIDPEGFIRRVREVYRRRHESVRDELRLRDGRVFDRYGAPLVGADGSYYGFAWYFRDVTEQKRNEEELVRSGERFANLAWTLQQSLLPPDLPEIPGVQLAARYLPAGAGIEVGGDFYDVFRSGPEAWHLVIGDVCGKGASAAALTALARHTLRAAATQFVSPAVVIGQLNEAMLRAAEEQDEGFAADRFATVACLGLRLVDRRFVATVGLGGHPPPVLLREDGTVETVGREGDLVGILPRAAFYDEVVDLGPGDTVVLLTDGVLEARDAQGVLLGEEGVSSMLRDMVSADAAPIADRIAEAALSWQGGRTRDDIAVLVVKVLSA
jgi:PAS domain S-box-containing protein